MGDAHERLHKSVRHINSARNSDAVYSNTMAIVQSSGMGNSRMVDRLAEDVFTLPFNFRNDNKTGGMSVAWLNKMMDIY